MRGRHVRAINFLCADPYDLAELTTISVGSSFVVRSLRTEKSKLLLHRLDRRCSPRPRVRAAACFPSSTDYDRAHFNFSTRPPPGRDASTLHSTATSYVRIRVSCVLSQILSPPPSYLLSHGLPIYLSPLRIPFLSVLITRVDHHNATQNSTRAYVSIFHCMQVNFHKVTSTLLRS